MDISLTYRKEIITSKTARALVGAAFFILATALGAYVRIPLEGTPVPITLQTFFVILSGAVLGRRLGSFSQFAYVILGAAGLPIFQAFSSGALYIAGPTGGYLAGFVAAAYFVGRMLGRADLSKIRVVASFIIADLIIHISGALWLAYLYRMSLLRAASIGILPFVPGEIVKIFFAVLIYSGISRRSKAIFSD